MALPTQPEYRRIAWNGVGLVLPSTWQVKVTSLQHLNIEDRSGAVMEVRWQPSDAASFSQFAETLTRQYQKLTGKGLTEVHLPPGSKHLFRHIKTQCFAEAKKTDPLFIFFYIPQASLFVMMQFYNEMRDEYPLQQIQSFDFLRQEDKSFSWSIQDFRASIPSAFILSKYTMKAGLTVLRFHQGKTVLNICRLALAQKRLEQQGFEEIFHSLLGEEKPQKPVQVTETSIRYKNSPRLLHQLGLRFQRKKPFHLAALRHDGEHDRIFGVFMEDIKPIDDDVFEKIYTSLHSS